MIKKVSLIGGTLIAAAVVIILVLAATKPDNFRIERTVRIMAPPEKIVGLIENLRGWSAWSPWEKIDPNLKRSFSGAERGVGAIYEWQGNSDVGKGRMEILDSSGPSRVIIKLDFLEPFEAHNTAEFILRTEGTATDLTWAMHGPAPLLSRVMHVFYDMDRMVGDQFEIGLGNLKALAES